MREIINVKSLGMIPISCTPLKYWRKGNAFFVEVERNISTTDKLRARCKALETKVKCLEIALEESKRTNKRLFEELKRTSHD